MSCQGIVSVSDADSVINKDRISSLFLSIFQG